MLSGPFLRAFSIRPLHMHSMHCILTLFCVVGIAWVLHIFFHFLFHFQPLVHSLKRFSQHFERFESVERWRNLLFIVYVRITHVYATLISLTPSRLLFISRSKAWCTYTDYRVKFNAAIQFKNLFILWIITMAVLLMREMQVYSSIGMTNLGRTVNKQSLRVCVRVSVQ